MSHDDTLVTKYRRTVSHDDTHTSDKVQAAKMRQGGAALDRVRANRGEGVRGEGVSVLCPAGRPSLDFWARAQQARGP